MVKYSSVKAVAGALLALAVACAYDARAGEVVDGVRFSSGMSFESVLVGPFDPMLSDTGDEYGPYYWYASQTTDVAQVVEYVPGAAYDYGSHGLTRNAYLESSEPDQANYCQLKGSAGLHRSIFARESYGAAFSNVLVRSGSRESIYCDMLTRFAASEDSPVPDETARFIVWARLLETDDGDLFTNLMVTAGCVTDRFSAVSVRHYCLDFGVDLSRWYRLTIRAHGDVSAQGIGLAGFSIYLDGEPVRAVAEDYEIVDPQDSRSFRLVPEARALQAERRLFLGLVTPGSDKAFTISGLTFAGEGLIDDVSFSSDDPGYAKPEAVFTFNWDEGFAAPLAYTLDGGLTTNDVPVATARSRDILIGSAPTNGLTLKVTDFSYKTALGFHPGVWLGSNGAVLTNGTEFVYDGTTRNPIATVVSTRETVDVGPGGYDVFRSAFAALDRSTNAVKTLRLLEDVIVSASPKRDAYGNRDEGYVSLANPDGEYVLDLDGHTLKGQIGKHPTLVVSCKSLRIIDSSVDKTGRILPVDDYLNPTGRLNTSVLVYPQAKGARAVEPVVTLQDGIYDGWVRNDGSLDGTTALTGVVFVEGGSYISTNGASFYLESGVTNRTMQFIYRSGYWSCLATNAVIWTGLGDGRNWSDPANWKNLAVPQSNETALFPSRPEDLPPWTVNVGMNGMTTKNLWLEGDVFLSGTNDFLTVSMKAGSPGRFCGDATLVYEGDQPGKLTESLLRDDWAGTVLLRKIGTSVPKVLKNLETWGTASSTVVFNGVRGYVMDVNSHTMPYDVVLRDLVEAGTTYLAWQNDSGYTGSTLAFEGSLSGDGTFRSGANARAILQLFKFADVRNFTGLLSVNGKRVLLGSETVMASDPGLIAFGDQVFVTSDLGWTCKTAIFGGALNVLGETNDVLVTCTAPPDVTTCTNLTLNGRSDVAWLACATNATTPRSYSVYISGTRPAHVAAAPLLTSAAPAAVFASVPAYYMSSDSGYSGAAYRSAARTLAEFAVQMADVSIEMRDEEILVVVGNASRGLWYGVRSRASLSDEWSSPGEWCQATGTSVTLTCPRRSDACFYEVVVTYEDPYRSGGSLR